MDIMTNEEYKKHLDRLRTRQAENKAAAARAKADRETFLSYMEGIKAQKEANQIRYFKKHPEEMALQNHLSQTVIDAVNAYIDRNNLSV